MSCHPHVPGAWNPEGFWRSPGRSNRNGASVLFLGRRATKRMRHEIAREGKSRGRWLDRVSNWLRLSSALGASR